MKTLDFNFDLDPALIAQNPVEPRDHCRLFVYDSATDNVMHKHFYDLTEFLDKNDVVVLNKSKVIPARLRLKMGSAEVEIFLLKKLAACCWQVLVRPGKKFPLGAELELDSCHLKVLEVLDDGARVIEVPENFDQCIRGYGEIPLPPYIKGSSATFDQYQTVFAKEEGSVAAPTAGLHFTPELIQTLKASGVAFEEVILHVGRGTFLPVSSDLVENHRMHEEEFEVSSEVADNLNKFKRQQKRFLAVGTTSVRVLESNFDGEFRGGSSATDIFIYPGSYNWKVVDRLITNFHLPKSTLIMLVASFLEGKGVENPVEKVMDLYSIAMKEKYRFYSFGDAMLII